MRKVLGVFTALLLLAITATTPVQAQTSTTEDCTEKKLRDLGVAIMNCSGSSNCSVAVPPAVSGTGQPDENGVYPIVGGSSSDGNPYHILSYIQGLDETAAANAINVYIQERRPESPFVGLGSSFVTGGKLYNVNPFLAVGHLQHENGFATAPSGWHTTTPPSYNAFGRSASSSQPHTIYTTSSGRERLVYQWSSWAASLDGNNGTEDPWFALINRRYLADREGSFRIASGDFATYISHYAPGSDGNNESAYVSGLLDTIDSIVGLMDGGAAYTGPSAGGGACASRGAGTVNTDGYSFPLAPQRRINYGGLPCSNPAGCHDHDGTPAFDLSYANVEGADVYAIIGGTIDRVNTQDPGWCQSIQLRGSDGFFYWYGHVIDVAVADGAAVTAGQPIAKVATWTEQHTCNGTSSGSHLHIDRGCSIEVNGVLTPQRGGNDNCRDPDFIPFLRAIYEGLPA